MRILFCQEEEEEDTMVAMVTIPQCDFGTVKKPLPASVAWRGRLPR